MQFHNLQRAVKQKKEKRIGRGGKRGTYSGRGIKGLGARAGGKFRPAEREILKKIPKLRGYKFPSFQSRGAVVNLDAVEKVFSDGDVVSPESLEKAKLVTRRGGAMPSIKILGRGTLTKKLTFKNVRFSHAAKKRVMPGNQNV